MSMSQNRDLPQEDNNIGFKRKGNISHDLHIFVLICPRVATIAVLRHLALQTRLNSETQSSQTEWITSIGDPLVE